MLLPSRSLYPAGKFPSVCACTAGLYPLCHGTCCLWCASPAGTAVKCLQGPWQLLSVPTVTAAMVPPCCPILGSTIFGALCFNQSKHAARQPHCLLSSQCCSLLCAATGLVLCNWIWMHNMLMPGWRGCSGLNALSARTTGFFCCSRCRGVVEHWRGG